MFKKKLAVDSKRYNEVLNPIIGWSVTASWNIPYTDISHRQSISGETLDIRTWKVNDIFRGTDPETNTYFESGYSIDENGIGGRQGIGGASDSIPFTLPNGIDTNLYSNLSWSITAEPARITWDKVVELALCAVFVTAGVLAIVGLTADDATGLGVADDSFLIPVTKFVTDKINAICEIKNIKNVRSRYRV